MENNNFFKAALRGRYALEHEMDGLGEVSSRTANRVYRAIFIDTARDYLKQPDAMPEIVQCFLLLPALAHMDQETVEKQFGTKVAMLTAEMHMLDDNTDMQSVSRAALKVFELYQDGKARSMKLIIDDMADLVTAQHQIARNVQQIQARVERLESDAAAIAKGLPRPLLH